MNEDRFADFLDAMVGGKAPPDQAPPADIARRLQESTTERLDGDRRSAIWNDLMSGREQTSSTTGGPGPLTQPALTAPDAFNPWVRRRLPRKPERKKLGIVHETMQSGITAMAIVAVVIAAFAAFPILRDDEATPRVTPTAWAAAPTTEAPGVGAASSPESPDATDWLTYIQPEECRAAPLGNDVYGTIVADVPSAPERQYGPLTTPSHDDARDVANAAREVQACALYGTSRERQSLETERHLSREQNGIEASLRGFPVSRETTSKGMTLSAQYAFGDPIDFIHVLYDEPPGPRRLPLDHEPYWVFQPNHAVRFKDGRIAIPREPAYWSGHPDAPSLQLAARLPMVPMSLLVFEQEVTGWRLDEVLPFCVGDCDGYWEIWEPGSGGNTPAVMPASTTGATLDDSRQAEDPEPIRPLPETPGSRLTQPAPSGGDNQVPGETPVIINPIEVVTPTTTP